MCNNCDWKDYVDKIGGLLENGRHDWAGDTLEGILEWVEKNDHITDKQKDAVDNIERP